ncbi:protocadherin beta-13-like [Tubulanus polymorphus]|uniref:protocadherin beta-13-like n=1 Tax=Tubulanus polymorphus TaxID=672921 RepID=UPI003DA245E5
MERSRRSSTVSYLAVMVFTAGVATSASAPRDDVRCGSTAYVTSVNEDRLAGFIVIRLRGGFSYRINSDASEQVKRTFSVQSDSGYVVLTKELDYETEKLYFIPVDVSSAIDDNSTTRLQRFDNKNVTTVSVIVRVNDVNDNAPVITVNAFASSGLIEVAEDAPAGTFLAQILVTDADSGMNGRSDCSLDAVSYEVIRMNRDEYRLFTRTRLDREKRSSNQVVFTCTDRGISGRLSRRTLSIYVLDVNDNKPMFSRSLYSGNIHENRLDTTPVIIAEAVDADSGANGRVSYRISDESGLFSIDAQHGFIYIHSRLDREVKSTYGFQVIATDSGEPRHTSTATVKIDVVDENDNAPVFSHDNLQFSIRSNALINATVGHVRATDADEGRNAEITYSLLPTDDRNARLFAVSPKLGAITIRSRLDLGKPQGEYKLQIIAKDNGRQPMTSSVSVRIRVIHPPQTRVET